MVTEKELNQFNNNETPKENVSYKVTAAELSGFIDNEYALAKKISDWKKNYEKSESISTSEAYYQIEIKCQLGEDTFKKAMCGTRKITRKFLYKFTVGMKMTLEEANEFFELCGGPLTRTSKEDYVCMNALRDKDSIEQLVSDFNKHLNISLGYKSTRK